jgi:hypothetical protein
LLGTTLSIFIPQEDQLSLPNPCIPRMKELSRLHLTALQLVNVVHRRDCGPWLVSMIRDALYGSSTATKPSEEKEDTRLRRRDSHNQCDLLLAALAELLVRAEEGDTGLINFVVSRDMRLSDCIVDMISVMASFCEVLIETFLKDIYVIIYIIGTSSFFFIPHRYTDALSR